MHDPMTLAFQVRNPFKRYSTLVEIWHVDPEKDGSDDSCGWFRPKLTKKQISTLSFLAGDEARDPWFQKHLGKKPCSAADAECLLRGAFIVVANALRVRISFDEAQRWAAELLHNPIDNVRSALCHLPGWHTNWKEDCEEGRKDTAEQFLFCIAKFILRERRPWYRHPRWHLHHWRIRIPLVQNFKRWAFSRCEKCGKGFKFGDAVVGTWDGKGPQWFSGEPNVSHMDCSGHGGPARNAGP